MIDHGIGKAEIEKLTDERFQTIFPMRVAGLKIETIVYVL